jgi:hypothetical protein
MTTESALATQLAALSLIPVPPLPKNRGDVRGGDGPIRKAIYDPVVPVDVITLPGEVVHLFISEARIAMRVGR